MHLLFAGERYSRQGFLLTCEEAESLLLYVAPIKLGPRDLCHLFGYKEKQDAAHSKLNPEQGPNALYADASKESDHRCGCYGRKE